MKKILTLLTAVFFCATLMSCNCNAEKCDFEVAVLFSFYKDKDQNEIFDTNNFKINTKVYVCVDFTITKNVESKERISFVVQIPYAEYYSTKDYYSGTIIPKENSYVQQDEHGREYTVMELNQMDIPIPDKNSHLFRYVFEIKANQKCKDAEFIVRFEPENSNLTVSVNQMKDKKAKTTYTFF